MARVNRVPAPWRKTVTGTWTSSAAPQPNHSPVRGWVILESYPRPDVWRFVALFVVEDE